MSTIRLRSQNGDVLGDVELAPALFDAQVNVPVMHQVVVAQMAAWRAGTHSTKTRGEVSGGGKKPYRQKGTGRARQGSIRAPHYAGGGVVWGPHPRDYTKQVPKKMRAAALRSALSDRAREGRVVVVDEISFDAPRTRDALALLNSLELDGKVLLVLHEPNDTVGRSFRNLQHVHVLPVDQLNTYDIVARDWLVLTRASLERLNQRAETDKNGGSTPASEPTPQPAVAEGGESQ